jgi:hypothetical protein
MYTGAMKDFNITGSCFEAQHYMIDISEKIAAIKPLVDKGLYFTINRARQYGKTTTINEPHILPSVCHKQANKAITREPLARGLAKTRRYGIIRTWNSIYRSNLT